MIWGGYAQPVWAAVAGARRCVGLYAVLVVVVSVVAATQPPSLLRDIVHTSSTNLVNLRQRPLSVLFASAFVISPVAGLWIVVPMVVAYGELQRWLGRVSLFVVAVLGHVGATLFVATMEVTELAKGRVGVHRGPSRRRGQRRCLRVIS